MRENRLCKISKNFKLFKNLETLHLDNNQISYIPSFISEFTQLKTFTISNNILTSIPASIQYLTALQTFKFSNNKVDKLPIEFGQLKSLECLYLDGNYYTEILSNDQIDILDKWLDSTSKEGTTIWKYISDNWIRNNVMTNNNDKNLIKTLEEMTKPTYELLKDANRKSFRFE
jgi:hypothetical protein